MGRACYLQAAATLINFTNSSLSLTAVSVKVGIQISRKYGQVLSDFYEEATLSRLVCFLFP